MTKYFALITLIVVAAIVGFNTSNKWIQGAVALVLVINAVVLLVLLFRQWITPFLERKKRVMSRMFSRSDVIITSRAKSQNDTD